MGGRFDEALSASLSVHGAHEEALRRIEHYSMTSMHSSAHSIRSMDSIRTELSRLEAMITSASVTHLPEIETRNSHARRGSNSTERRVSAVEEGGDRGPNLAISGPLPEHNGGSSTTAPLDEIRKSLDRSSQPQRTGEMAVEDFVQHDYHITSVDYRSFLDEPDDINNQYMENLSEEGNKSSFLYAEFSKNSQPRQHESPESRIDRGAIHHVLRESLAVMYPPQVVEYISLRQVTTLCENHIDLLDKSPSVQMLAIGKMKEISYVNDGAPASARPSMINLRDRLIELRNAIKISRKRCIQAGYSLSELDRLLSQPGSGSRAPSDRQLMKPETYSGDDSSSVYSDDFHSTTE